MSSKELESFNQYPLRTEYQGSVINVVNIDEILRESYKNRLIILDNNNFEYPIDRLIVTSQVINCADENCLALSARIYLEGYTLDSSWIIERFKKYFVPQEDDVNNLPSRSDFEIKNVTFNNSYLIDDSISLNKFLLWIKPHEKVITLSNFANLYNQEKHLTLEPPAIKDVPISEQFECFSKALVLMADFVNSFNVVDQRNELIYGMPMMREYLIGEQIRPLNDVNINKISSWTGRIIKASSLKNELNSGNLQLVKNVESEENEKSYEKIKLEDIGGLEEVKNTLREIAISFTNSEIMNKWGAERPKGILLYGEPGTGKTMLVNALANEINGDIWLIDSADIYDRWLGTSEQHLKEIFNKAKNSTDKPIVIFFDEFESIIGINDAPSSSADNARNSVSGLFKSEMDELKKYPHILVVATSNNIDKINTSLKRKGRFDYTIYVPMPDRESRAKIVINIISQLISNKESDSFKMFADDINVQELAMKTDGFSGADLKEVFRRICLQKAMTEAKTKNLVDPISQNDIINCIERFRKEG